MRNPGKTSEACVESETTSKAFARESERDLDDCSSPPCKRLKQGVLPFSRFDSPSLTSDSSKASVSPLSNSTSESKPHNASEEQIKVNGGLVTAAPSPPDVKQNSVKPEASPNLEKVSMNFILDNGVQTATGANNASDTSSPKANSSCEEYELMIMDQSPPIKGNSKSEINARTPLQRSAEKQKRREEREKERQEKQRLREEKLKERQEAKAVKEKERLEAKRKRDQERQEKQAEKERREKERLEKREKEEKERLEKKEKKDEEKRKREEEKNAKLEEKRKREAEKRSIEEEQERKRQKSQESSKITKFFNKPSTPIPKVMQTENNSRFKPFEIKPGMTVAPVRRRELPLDFKNLLDEGLRSQEVSVLYLKELDKRKPIIRCTKRNLSTIDENTESNSENKESINDDENSNSSIEILEPKSLKSLAGGLRCKLLQFHTNYRPAYFGTWRKNSKMISPKNPFKKDLELLDYEVDSDDEWEEEEPGESLSNSEGEDEADGEEGNEDDDGFFVPHGYLSDDEGVLDEEMEDNGENDKKDTNSEGKKDQQLAKAKAWEAELKRKCKPMKPVTVGCLWLDDASLNLTLKQFAACLLVDAPVDIEISSNIIKNNDVPVDSPSTMNNGGLYVPDEAMPELIKLIHGNTSGLNKLISQFRKQWTSKCLGKAITDEEVDEKSPISKRQLEKKIQNIAVKERRFDRLRWYVHNHILRSYGLENLERADGRSSDVSADAVKTPVFHHTTTITPSIIQFTRPVSPEVHKNTSLETKHQSPPKIKPVSASDNSLSPMEIDNANPLHNFSHCEPDPVSGSTSGETLNCMKNILNSQTGQSSLHPSLTSTSNTKSVPSQETSSAKYIETLCID